MLKALTDMFAGLTGDAAGTDAVSEHELQLATAVLLVETARVDYSHDDVEREAIIRLLSEHLSLSGQEIATLIENAESEADHAASLQGFTRRLHDELEYDEKQRIVEMLWQVAFADDELSKHEDGLVRKVGDLLYVSRSDQMRLREAARERSGAR